MKIDFKTTGLEHIVNHLKEQSDRLKKLNPLWRNVGEYMVKTTTKRFNKAEAPDGTPWEPLKAPSKTRERRTAQGRNTKRKGQMKPLSDTGRLRQSIHYLTMANGVLVGTNLKYAAIHQFGGDIQVTPKMRAYLHSQGIHLRKSTNTIHIPARPFLGVSDEDMKVIHNMMQKHVQKRT